MSFLTKTIFKMNIALVFLIVMLIGSLLKKKIKKTV